MGFNLGLKVLMWYSLGLILWRNAGQNVGYEVEHGVNFFLSHRNLLDIRH
jgi:hypothetical protein